MSLSNIKLRQYSQGFTIVELLIVIVVIGILATITIVAYNNVISRANLTSAQAAASSVARKAEAFNAENSAYPTTLADLMNSTDVNETWGIAPGSYTLLTAAPTAAPSSPSSIGFYACDSGDGVKVGYWDYVAGAFVSATTTTYTAGDVSGTCTLSAT